MRPLTLLVGGLALMWFITSGRAEQVWTVLTNGGSLAQVGAPPPTHTTTQ